MKRSISLMAAWTGIICAGLLCAIAPAAMARPLTGEAVAAPAAHAADSVTYTSKTVVIPRSVVQANLIGIAPGGIFKFKHAAGPLANLKVGSVMLLQGSSAGIVTKVQTQGGKLIVTTKNAQPGDVIKSGTIPFASTPDVSKAFVAPINQPGASADVVSVAPRFATPGYPFVDGGAAHAASGPALTIQGGSGPFGYSVTGEPVGNSAMHLSGTLCYGHGDICGNGPARGVSLEATFDGTVDLSQISGDMALKDGSIDKLKAAFKSVKSNFKVDYTFARGEGDAGSLKFPAFHVPLGIDIPLAAAGPIPIFARLQLGFLFQVISKSVAKNTVSHGAAQGAIDGSATITDNGGSPSESGSGSATGAVSAGKQGLGISPGLLGLTVTTQVKEGIGLGATIASLVGYVDETTTIGQEQSAAVAGGFCSSYIGVFTLGAGIEAQVGNGGLLGLSAGKHWDLKQNNFFFTEPGCKKIST
jgi:hypothetical protein